MSVNLKEILDRLDFASAIPSASTPNDLLPSRLEDKVGGELSKEFVAYLEKIITEEKYTVNKASFVHVPKPGFTTRPAALLTLTDRIIYESLVETIKAKIEKKLISSNYVLWPRAIYKTKKWGKFEESPIEAAEEYIVNIDITAFYDSIDHSILEDKIVQLIGEDTIAECISKFLSAIMDSRKGLPQGLLPSDTLATLYLQTLDSAMLRSGFNYWRHGDDIRMSAKNISLARKSIAIAEIELRKIGLVLNSSKCTIKKTAFYEKDLLEISKVYELIKDELYQDNVDDVCADSDALEKVMDDAELDNQMKWDLFYHGSISIEDVILEIGEHLQPKDIDVAVKLFTKTMIGIPDGETPLPNDQFHVQIKKSMLKLAAGKSDIAIKQCSSLIAKFPDKTELVCNYLIALSSLSTEEVTLQIEDIINSELFLTSWQTAWVYRVLINCTEHITEKTKNNIIANCNNQHVHWLERVEGFKVLAKSGKLSIDQINQCWEIAPLAYKPDLIAAAVYLSPTSDKANRFLEGIKQSPIEKVVARHCMISEKNRADKKLSKSTTN